MLCMVMKPESSFISVDVVMEGGYVKKYFTSKKGQKLENLYKVLLTDSSFDKCLEFNISNAVEVFKEYDIINYGINRVYCVREFSPPLNSCDTIDENLERIYGKIPDEADTTRQYDLGYTDKHLITCHCGTPIMHTFKLRNRVTGKEVEPIGNECILKFAANDLTRSNVKKFMKHVRAYQREQKDEPRKRLKLMNRYLIDECADYFSFDVRKINKKNYIDDMLKAMGFYTV
jgi:hypothetical protein